MGKDQLTNYYLNVILPWFITNCYVINYNTKNIRKGTIFLKVMKIFERVDNGIQCRIGKKFLKKIIKESILRTFLHTHKI